MWSWSHILTYKDFSLAHLWLFFPFYLFWFLVCNLSFLWRWNHEKRNLEGLRAYIQKIWIISRVHLDSDLLDLHIILHSMLTSLWNITFLHFQSLHGEGDLLNLVPLVSQAQKILNKNKISSLSAWVIHFPYSESFQRIQFLSI